MIQKKPYYNIQDILVFFGVKKLWLGPELSESYRQFRFQAHCPQCPLAPKPRSKSLA